MAIEKLDFQPRSNFEARFQLVRDSVSQALSSRRGNLRIVLDHSEPDIFKSENYKAAIETRLDTLFPEHASAKISHKRRWFKIF